MFQGACYKATFGEFGFNFDEAKQMCVDQGAYLTDVTSQEELYYIRDLR